MLQMFGENNKKCGVCNTPEKAGVHVECPGWLGGSITHPAFLFLTVQLYSQTSKRTVVWKRTMCVSVHFHQVTLSCGLRDGSHV